MTFICIIFVSNVLMMQAKLGHIQLVLAFYYPPRFFQHVPAFNLVKDCLERYGEHAPNGMDLHFLTKGIE